MKEYSPALISLLKGIVYNTQEDVWDLLLKYEPSIKKYFDDICLEVYIDPSEGYAYLKQKQYDDLEIEMPKIIEKRPLNFHISLLCLLLRKHLIEVDTQGIASRAIISKDDIVNLMKPFLKDTYNESKQEDQIKAAIKKVTDEGFLRKLKNEENLYEINRIIKAFINAESVQQTLDKYKNNTQQVDNE